MLPRMVRKREGGSRNQARWLRIREEREEMKMRWRRERGRDGKNRLRVGTERGEGEYDLLTSTMILMRDRCSGKK